MKVCMHEHVICNIKNIMGSTQSKPTRTQHFNIIITHLKCTCDAMHDELTSFKQKPIQKISHKPP